MWSLTILSFEKVWCYNLAEAWLYFHFISSSLSKVRMIVVVEEEADEEELAPIPKVVRLKSEVIS